MLITNQIRNIAKDWGFRSGLFQTYVICHRKTMKYVNLSFSTNQHIIFTITIKNSPSEVDTNNFICIVLAWSSVVWRFHPLGWWIEKVIKKLLTPVFWEGHPVYATWHGVIKWKSKKVILLLFPCHSYCTVFSKHKAGELFWTFPKLVS